MSNELWAIAKKRLANELEHTSMHMRYAGIKAKRNGKVPKHYSHVQTLMECFGKLSHSNLMFFWYCKGFTAVALAETAWLLVAGTTKESQHLTQHFSKHKSHDPPLYSWVQASYFETKTFTLQTTDLQSNLNGSWKQESRTSSKSPDPLESYASKAIDSICRSWRFTLVELGI